MTFVALKTHTHYTLDYVNPQVLKKASIVQNFFPKNFIQKSKLQFFNHNRTLKKWRNKSEKNPKV